MIIGRDQTNMISLNLKTLQLQRLNEIATLVSEVTTCGQIYAVLMKSSSWLSILVLSSTVFKLSRCDTSVTKSMGLTMAARPKQGQGASRTNIIKKGSEP